MTLRAVVAGSGPMPVFVAIYAVVLYHLSETIGLAVAVARSANTTVAVGDERSRNPRTQRKRERAA